MRKIFYSFPIVISLLFGCENSTEVHNSYDYSIEQKRDCFCPQADSWVKLFVQSDTIAKAIKLSDNSELTRIQYSPYKSIKELYDFISYIDTSTFYMYVETDSINHYPSYIYCKPKSKQFGDTAQIILDAQLSYTTRNYNRLN